jgi:hypothetical protein
MRRKRTKTRNTAADLFARVSELVLLTDRREFPTRQNLALRWKMTPRAVSYVVTHARAVYGVVVIADTNHARGYVLVDPGVLNVAALERWQR